MEPLVVSDGTDTATLTPGEDSWTIKLEVPPDQPERVQRLLEAAAQAAVRRVRRRPWARLFPASPRDVLAPCLVPGCQLPADPTKQAQACSPGRE